MAPHDSMEWPLRLPEGTHVMWRCPQCGATQDPDDITTVEITEPGRDPRVEYHGKIRPSYFYEYGVSWIVYDCLVCGYSWNNLPENPTPDWAPITFLHPINECDRDCC